MKLKGITLNKLISFLITSAIIICVMPFNHIKAESETYKECSSACEFAFTVKSTNSPNDLYKVSIRTAEGIETRALIFKTSSQYIVYQVSLYTGSSNIFSISNMRGGTGTDPSCDSLVGGSSSSYDSVYFKYYGRAYSYSSANYDFSSDYPVIEVNSSPDGQLAYRYTYGDLSVDPVVEPTYGQLKIGFTSSIAYSGGNSNAWRDNKDTIYFDRYDTLGNDLKGLNIELQAVPYTTEASSKQNLLGQRFNEFFYDTVRVGSLGFYSPGQNPVDFTWEYITNRFSPTWWSTYGDNWSLTGWYLSDHWYKVGWCYRARVVDDEMNTIIDWQTIYNGTSIDAQDTDNIINNNGYNPDLVNSINEINNFNNTTNNNYYNNQVINYNDGNLTSDGSWIEEFIRGIFETLGDIINAISGIGSSIIKGIFDLISNLGVNILDTFTNLWNGFINLFNGINFTDDNPDFDLDLGVQDGDSPLDIIPAFVRMMNSSGLGYMLWLPLVVGIIFMVL